MYVYSALYVYIYISYDSMIYFYAYKKYTHIYIRYTVHQYCIYVNILS